MRFRAAAVAATRSSSNLVSKNGARWLSAKAKYLSGQTAHLRLGGHVGGKDVHGVVTRCGADIGRGCRGPDHGR
jgi:hypothetical protein